MCAFERSEKGMEFIMSFFKDFYKYDISENYFESIQKTRQSLEYKGNEKQIEYITNLLVKYADVPY